jgi:hypothetical protein
VGGIPLPRTIIVLHPAIFLQRSYNQMLANRHVNMTRIVPSSEAAAGALPGADFRLIAGVLLLAVAIVGTALTIDGLAARRVLRTDLAEISHVRYGLFNADRWVERLTPILEAGIDRLDFQTANNRNLRAMVENALYRLLDDVKDKMSAKNSPGAGGGGLLGQSNSFLVNMMVGVLRPHVPEYAGFVLAELSKPESKDAVKQYLRTALAEGARSTFGNVDMSGYASLLEQRRCKDGAACKQELEQRIHEADAKIFRYYWAILISSGLALVLLIPGQRVFRPSTMVVLLLFCVVLLAGGLLTPMIEVEAKITEMKITFLGEPITFSEQVVYFQSKSVFEVFRALIDTSRPDMWAVGVLVLIFSVIFPVLKLFASAACLFRPTLLRQSRIVRFFSLESSRWSMADVMALAIFMAFVAFNGLIGNAIGTVSNAGPNLAIPTDSSKILPGYYLFIGFCLSSLFVSRKLASGIAALPLPPERTEQTASA